MVVPFHGSYHDFYHVIQHELVHVFTLSRIDAALDRRARSKYPYPPLWFIEGIAEYWSENWDSDADMIIADMVISGMLPSIKEMGYLRGTYFMYKLGESICHFIDSTYGPDKLTQIFDNWHKGRVFEQVIELTTGDNLEELSDKWTYYLKKK